MLHGKNPKISSLLVYATVALLAAGTVYAAALLYPVVVSDTLLLLDEPGLRSRVSDTFDPQAEGDSSKPATRDAIDTTESTTHSATAIEDLGLSDSAVAIASLYFEISVSSAVGLSDEPALGAGMYDTVQIADKKSLSASFFDGFSLLDYVGRGFIVLINEAFEISEEPAILDEAEITIEDEDEEYRGNSGGPRRIVHDPSYFETRPLSRMQISGLDTNDEEGSTLAQLHDGMQLVISVTARNFQQTDQDYVMYAQITDQKGIAVSIIVVSGTVAGGELGEIESSWEALQGSYHISVFLVDGSPHPYVISDTFTETIVVQ